MHPFTLRTLLSTIVLAAAALAAPLASHAQSVTDLVIDPRNSVELPPVPGAPVFVPKSAGLPLNVGIRWDCTDEENNRPGCTLKAVTCDDDGFCYERVREPECVAMHGGMCDYTAIPERELQPLVINVLFRCEDDGYGICDLVLQVCDLDDEDEPFCFEV